MKKRNRIIGGAAEHLVRRRIISQQEHQQEVAATLQRPDRITTILCGVDSPLAQGGTQTCTAVFVNGQFLLFDAGNNALASMQASDLPLHKLVHQVKDESLV